MLINYLQHRHVNIATRYTILSTGGGIEGGGAGAIDITEWLHSCYGSNIIVCCSETW